MPTSTTFEWSKDVAERVMLEKFPLTSVRLRQAHRKRDGAVSVNLSLKEEGFAPGGGLRAAS